MHFAYIYLVIVNLLIWNINGAYYMGQLYTSEANNTYYIEFKTEFTWYKSQYVCSEMNMTLVEFSSNTKSQELITLIHKAEKQKHIYGNFFWTGGILKELPVDNFVWQSTGEKFNYTDWFISYPDAKVTPNSCIEISKAFDWKWRHYDCSSRNGFICEYKPETTIYQTFKNLEKKLQTEIEKNRNLQKELQQQQNEQQGQLGKLKEQHLEAQQQFQLQSLVALEQKLKFEEDLQAEKIKQNNLKEQIKQLTEEQKKTMELKEINWQVNKGTTDLQQSDLQSNRPINIIYFNNIYSN